MGKLLEPADPALRRKVDDLAGRYVRSTRNVGLAVGLLAGDESSGPRVREGRPRRRLGRRTGTPCSRSARSRRCSPPPCWPRWPAAGRSESTSRWRSCSPPGSASRHRGRPIALAHLAEHTSALPRLPGNLWATATDKKNPYRDYQVAHLYEYLSGAASGSRPGPGWRIRTSGPGCSATASPCGPACRSRTCWPSGCSARWAHRHRDHPVGRPGGPVGTGPHRQGRTDPQLGHPDAGRCRGAAVHGRRDADLPAGEPGPARDAGGGRPPRLPRPPAGGLVAAGRGRDPASPRAGGRVAADPAGRPAAGRELEVPGRVLPAGAGRPRVEGLLGGGVGGGRGVGRRPAALGLVRWRGGRPAWPCSSSSGSPGFAAGYLPPRGRVRLGWQEARSVPAGRPCGTTGGRAGTAASSGSWPGRGWGSPSCRTRPTKWTRSGWAS